MRFFDKKELKWLWPFYADAFLGTVLFILIPFQIIYFSSIGLSSTQIGILIGMVPLISLLSEIPTGAVADLYGRKFSVIFGWLLSGLALMIVPLSNNYYYLIFTAALSGFAMTFISGASDAWVVDLLHAKKMKPYIKEFFVKRMSFYNLAFMLSGVLGTLAVAIFGIKSIFIISGGSLWLTSAFLAFGKEIYTPKKPRLKESLRHLFIQAKSSLHYGYKHHVLFYFLQITLLVAISANLSQFISWTPFLKSFNFPDYAFGILWSVMAVIGMSAPFISKIFLKRNNEKNLLITASVITLVWGIIILFTNNILFALIMISISSLIVDATYPVSDIFFQRFLPTKMRATLGSIRGMIGSLGAIIGIPLAGLLVDHIGSRYTIFISAMICLPILLLYLRIKEKKPQQKPLKT